MPIVCEVVKDIPSRSTYGSDKDFVLAYPKPIPETPLGPNWKFTPCFLPAKYQNFIEQIENFNVRPDDVFSITFPKSGSTWSQEMIWLLNNNLDYKTAKETIIARRFTQIELDICFKQFNFDVLPLINKNPSPRHIKSHLPMGLLPPQIWTVKPKIIYTCRSTKDTAISYYHHYKNIHQYSGSMQDFLDAYLDNQIIFSPQHGHIRDFWAIREEENVLFLSFEDIKRDTLGVLKKVSTFLGKNYTIGQLEELEKFLSFESMKSNEKTLKDMVTQIKEMSPSWEFKVEDIPDDGKKRNFIRKGVVGSHKEEMPAELIQRFDAWTNEFNEKHSTNILP